VKKEEGKEVSSNEVFGHPAKNLISQADRHRIKRCYFLMDTQLFSCSLQRGHVRATRVLWLPNGGNPASIM
jgi:hypothetical protein